MIAFGAVTDSGRWTARSGHPSMHVFSRAVLGAPLQSQGMAAVNWRIIPGTERSPGVEAGRERAKRSIDDR